MLIEVCLLLETVPSFYVVIRAISYFKTLSIGPVSMVSGIEPRHPDPSPLVRESETVLDSGFHAVDPDSRYSCTRFQSPCVSGFLSLVGDSARLHSLLGEHLFLRFF